MTPSNICSGLQRCGNNLFNPNAIDCTISTENPTGRVQQEAGISHEDGEVEDSIN